MKNYFCDIDCIKLNKVYLNKLSIKYQLYLKLTEINNTHKKYAYVTSYPSCDITENSRYPENSR